MTVASAAAAQPAVAGAAPAAARAVPRSGSWSTQRGRAPQTVRRIGFTVAPGRRRFSYIFATATLTCPRGTHRVSFGPFPATNIGRSGRFARSFAGMSGFGYPYRVAVAGRFTSATRARGTIRATVEHAVLGDCGIARGYGTWTARWLAAPRLTLTPATGTAGSRILLRGAGFLRNETVTVSWPGQSRTVSGTVFPGSQGAFRALLTLGAPPVGRHAVTACQRDCQVRIQRTLRVTASAARQSADSSAAPRG